MYGVFTNICPKNHPVMSVNIPAPWIIWVWVWLKDMSFSTWIQPGSRLVGLFVLQAAHDNVLQGDPQSSPYVTMLVSRRNPPDEFWGHKSETGWWYTYPSEKYKFVSWDYETPNPQLRTHRWTPCGSPPVGEVGSASRPNQPLSCSLASPWNCRRHLVTPPSRWCLQWDTEGSSPRRTSLPPSSTVPKVPEARWDPTDQWP